MQYTLVILFNSFQDSGEEISIKVEIFQDQSLLPNEVNTNDTTVQLPSDSQSPTPEPECSTILNIRKNMKSSKRKISNYDHGQNEAYNLLKELQSKKSRDRFTIFGEHVAMKIQALESSYAQNVVEHLISNILFEGSIGKYDYPIAGHMTPFSTHSSNSSFSVHTHLSSPQCASSPSAQLQHISQQIQNPTLLVPETVCEPLTPKYESSLSPQSQYTLSE